MITMTREQTIAKITEHFLPQVLRQVDMNSVIDPKRYSVAHVESDWFYEIQIDLDGMFGSDVALLLQRVDAFCVWEHDDEDELLSSFRANNYDWRIGDGDDGSAVFMRKGKLCIWVRGLPIEE